MDSRVLRALRMKPKQEGVYATEHGWVIDHIKRGYRELLVSFPSLATLLHNEGILKEHSKAEEAPAVTDTPAAVVTEQVPAETVVTQAEEVESAPAETVVSQAEDVEEAADTTDATADADKPKRGRKPKAQA